MVLIFSFYSNTKSNHNRVIQYCLVEKIVLTTLILRFHGKKSWKCNVSALLRCWQFWFHVKRTEFVIEKIMIKLILSNLTWKICRNCHRKNLVKKRRLTILILREILQFFIRNPGILWWYLHWSLFISFSLFRYTERNNYWQIKTSPPKSPPNVKSKFLKHIP